MKHLQQTALENIVGKEEIARNEQFLLFPQCFLLNQIIVSPFVHIFDIISFLLLKWKNPKLAYEVKGYLDIMYYEDILSPLFEHASDVTVQFQEYS